MELDKLYEQFKELTLKALDVIARSQFGVDGCRKAIAYGDTRKDALITALDSFLQLTVALGQVPAVLDVFGPEAPRRLAIQFVFNTCRRLADGSSADVAFDEVWTSLKEEVATPTWTYRAVANIQNIKCSENAVELCDGVSVRKRSSSELLKLMDWGLEEFECLLTDWKEGHGSAFVLLVEEKACKTPENFILVDSFGVYTLAMRALLAMRLHAPGDVRIGRLFVTRPARFNTGIGGIGYSGLGIWRPGTDYTLTPEGARDIQHICSDLSLLEQLGDENVGSLRLALRSFSSIYDRLHGQEEDRIVDAITALEAIWGLDSELSFRLALQTATLLAAADDERVRIYETLKDYYKIRSKVVHGTALKSDQASRLLNDEPLRTVVRRALRAFLHLAVHPGEWTLNELRKNTEIALIHAAKREELRAAMGL